MIQVFVIYHFEPEGWWAESPDVTGYTAAAHSLTELRELVLDGLRFYLRCEDVVMVERFAPSSSAPGSPDLVVSSAVRGGGPVVTIDSAQGVLRGPGTAAYQLAEA